jgi:hypothetical protein
LLKENDLVVVSTATARAVAHVAHTSVYVLFGAGIALVVA